MAAISKAEIDRSSQTVIISMIERKVASHATAALSISTAETQMEKARKCQDSIFEIHNRIAHLAPTDLDDHEAIYEGLSTRLDNAISTLKEIIKSSSPPPVTPPPHAVPVPKPPTIKLPDMKLPSFEGRFEDWPSFEDLFKATVDKNTTLSGAQKLQYLKSCVTGEASNLIKSFTITDSNYLEAWNFLSNRYNNKREIIYSLVKKILYQQHIKSESVSSLQQLLNTTLECVRSLKVLGRPTDAWDDLLIVSVVEKMDPESKSEWAKSLTGTNPSKFTELIDFMERHIRSLIARGAPTTKVINPAANASGTRPHHHQQGRQQARSHHISTLSSSSSCSLCQGGHQLYQCSKLHEMPSTQRMNAVMKTKACTNCLKEGHRFSACPSKHVCKHCSKKHHSFIHPHSSSENSSASSAQSGGNPPPARINSHTSSSISTANTNVLLKTAIVNVTDSFGNPQPCRVLLDDGSEASFITEKCAQSLGLIKTRTDVQITGISAANAAHVHWKTTVRLHSRIHNANVDIEALLLPKVTGTLPRVPCDTSLWTHLSDLPLADPSYHQPSEIDILLGADVVASIMREGRRQGASNTPIAQNSIFGWVLSGRVSTIKQTIINSNVATCRLESLVGRFWEVEELPNRKPLTMEEKACEQFYQTTTTRDSDGRYMVRLPFHPQLQSAPLQSIGDTYTLAERRLYQLEKRFEKHPNQHVAYKTFMQEYVNLGHMEEATPTTSAVFIPHHFVCKEDSSTTKLRVVFDASMKSAKGVSLNDMLMVGPTVQDDLFSLLIRFRLHPIALKGDVEKMYRQFQIHPDDRDFLRILWREDKEQPIKQFQLKTVTYGTAPAPYQATRSLQQLGKDEQEKFPEAAAVIQKDMYVDDLISGSSTTSKAIKLTEELNSIISAGAMSLRKWCSNDPSVMAAIPKELREEGSELTFDQDSSIKALGIAWHPQSDVFKFNSKSSSNAATKRELLSEIAKTFDPLGWLSPLTINAKILFQQSWQLTTNWDSPLEPWIAEAWKQYQQQLTKISALQIPRCIVMPNVVTYQLHGFSDASEQAYASAVYLKCILSDDTIIVNLIASRTRVAPLHQVSLPRLELCGAVLLAETIESIQGAINIKCTTTCYTDSMIVIKWLSSSSRRWKTYVANRVAAIQELIPSEHWHHVPGVENPADLPSRGITTDELINSELWWHGPAWLSTPTVPVFTSEVDIEAVKREEKSTMKQVFSNQASLVIPHITAWVEQFSTLRKLISTTAIIIMFIKSRANRIEASYPIPPLQRVQTRNHLIARVQAVSFPEEIRRLKEGKEIQSASPLIKLIPYLDGAGVLRVTGRLNNSPISSDIKQPIVLPKSHPLTMLIIEDCHQRHYHGGPTLMLAALREEFWIIGARDSIRLITRKCVRCRKTKAQTMQQLMGQLPAARVTPHRPFLHSGVDFAGPFQIKMRRGRGSISEKCWFAIFICFATKAVHLEAVTSLSTDGFIAAYRRFTARRGLCSHLYSDCGTNFVGADRELRKTLQQAEKQFQQQLSHLGTTWSFNPPAAPHQGGLWEAGVKSVKYHLRRVVSPKLLTLEQFETILCNIEACLNSRPLYSISNNPDDLAALTPGHFLIGGPLTTVPEPDLTLLKKTHLDYWQEAQLVSQHVWTRWKAEYLTTLQQRFKWVRKQPNLSVGDLVVIKEDNQPPTRWKLGRVISVHPGKDNLVRKATLRTVIDVNSKPVRYGETVRPIQKLSPLLLCNEMKFGAILILAMFIVSTSDAGVKTQTVPSRTLKLPRK